MASWHPIFSAYATICATSSVAGAPPSGPGLLQRFAMLLAHISSSVYDVDGVLMGARECQRADGDRVG